MAYWPSEEWMSLFKDAINASPEYKAAAANWEGTMAYVFQAEPDKGLLEDVCGFFDLWHGECRDARQIPVEDAATAAFVITAPYSIWKQVMKRQLDPIKAIMQGKMRMKGDLPTVVRNTKAAQVLNEVAGTVPSEYLDELPSEAIEELAAQGLPVRVPPGRS